MTVYRAKATLLPSRGLDDIRAFHDAVLAQGAVPMDVLDHQIHDWIDAQMAPESAQETATAP